MSSGRSELDRAEFERVYRTHSRAVFSTALFSVGVDLAAEVTQEAFIRFWERPERFDPRRSLLRTYLLMIARNVAIDTMRSQQARSRRDDRFYRAEVPSCGGLDHELLRVEQIQCLLGAIEQLSAAHREVIVTTYYGEVSYQAAALILDIPEGTVKSRIRAALRELRAAMAASA